MTTITCKIPEKFNAELEAFAREQRVTKSAIVRKALEERLGRRATRSRPRALAVVRALCGTLHGPPDLTSNPAHMEGFGE